MKRPAAPPTHESLRASRGRAAGIPAIMIQADALATTDLERTCLAALRRAAGVTDGAMERHSVRVFLLMELQAETTARPLDREAAICASLLHDVGLFPCAATRDAYVADGRRFTDAILAPLGWAEARRALCLDAVEYHHSLRAQWQRGFEVEWLRRADAIDVSAGALRFGLDRHRVRAVFESVPRAGLYAELARQVWGMVRARPGSLPGIFLRGSGTNGPR